MANLKLCSVEGCDKPFYGKGLCNTHWQRKRRHGSPTGGPMTNAEKSKFLRDVIITYEGDECLPWPYMIDSDGYGRIYICGKTKKVHRVVCEEVNGPPPTPEHEAAHSCGKGHLACCTPNHLRWATPKENAADMIVHGTKRIGEKHGMAKLNEQQVLEIRGPFRGFAHREIASRYGISRALVWMIQNRQIWKHI